MTNSSSSATATTAPAPQGQFDQASFQAALRFYGLPIDYRRVFRQADTGRVDKNGKPITTLVQTSARFASENNFANWVQINAPSDKSPNKKANNADIEIVRNITLDWEYPPDPELCHRIGIDLAKYLVSYGFAEPGLPVEDSGAGSHIVLPIRHIDTIKLGGGELVNEAVGLVVKEFIKPEFNRLAAEYGLDGLVKLEGFDISRILSAPGSWRPYNPRKDEKNGCPNYLRSGYLRRWLEPYAPSSGKYPVRRESENLARLVEESVAKILAKREEEKQTRLLRRKELAVNAAQAYDWITKYAGSMTLKGNRSDDFFRLLCAIWLKFGDEQILIDNARLVDGLTGGKYRHNSEKEVRRALPAVTNLSRENPERNVKVARNTTINEPAKKLTKEEISRGYRTLIDACRELAPEHTAYLAGQGIALDDNKMFVGTYRRSNTKKLAQLIIANLGEDKARLHPAIKVQETEDGRSWLECSVYVDGLLLAWTNRDGLITHVQVRNDSPACAENRRYRWIGFAGNFAPTENIAYFKQPSSDANNTETTNVVVLATTWETAARATQSPDYLAVLGCPSIANVNLDKLLAALDKTKATTLVLWPSVSELQNNRALRATQLLINTLTACRPSVKLFTASVDGMVRAAAARLQYTDTNGKKQRIGTRFEDDLPMEAYKVAFPDQAKMRPAYTLQDIQDDNGVAVNEWFGENNIPIQIVNANLTGTGKSYEVDYKLAKVAKNMLWPDTDSEEWAQGGKRVLVLCPTAKNIEERFAPGTPMGEAYEFSGGIVHIQRGRRVLDVLHSPEDARKSLEEPTIYDCFNPDAEIAGKNRQIPAKDVCKGCPFANEENWVKTFPDEDLPPRYCEETGYLASKEALKTAMIVYATKDAFLNGSSELKKFDKIVVDEDTVSYLIDIMPVTAATIAEWRTNLTKLSKSAIRNLNAPTKPQAVGGNRKKKKELPPQTKEQIETNLKNWTLLFDILGTALNTMPSRFAFANEKQLASTAMYPAYGAVGDAAIKHGLNRVQFHRLIEKLYDNGNHNTYIFESVWTDRFNKLHIPFRGAQNLLAALLNSDQANLRLHTQQSPDGTYFFKIYKVRDHLIKILTGEKKPKQLLILDATPPPSLKKLFPNLIEHKLEVRQPLEIWQVTSGLYTARDLGNKKTRELLEKAIIGWAIETEVKSPVVMMPKRLQLAPVDADQSGYASEENALKLPAGYRVEHFGLHKASNQYQGCDGIILVGHFQPPVADRKAELDCIRAYQGGAAITEAKKAGFYREDIWQEEYDSDTDEEIDETANGQPRNISLKMYNHLADGKASGRWSKNLADPELQTWFAKDYEAAQLQAIGRLRAIRQSEKLKVLILTSDPVGNLQIDELKTLQELADLATAVRANQPNMPVELKAVETVAKDSKASVGNIPPSNLHFPNTTWNLQKEQGDVSFDDNFYKNYESDEAESQPPPTGEIGAKSEKYLMFAQKLSDVGDDIAQIQALVDRISNGIWLDKKADQQSKEQAELLTQYKKRLDELRRCS